MKRVAINHFHLFCGLGGGAAGFNDGEARVGEMQAEFRCLGGIDSDVAAIEDFNQLTGARGTVLDLFDRDQYTKWHGHQPPEDWRECTPDDIRKAAGNERPNIVFTSAPCKGFSGLLSHKRSTTDKYQALNRLTLRGIWLTLEAWKDDPVEFILFENVPRIATRGRPLLDQINALLHQYGYATAETTHDCGELGGLAQSRKRFLLVARHVEKVPPFLYEPRKKPLRAVGEVLGQLPMPGDLAAGPMHRIPELQWKTWVRLALVEAGKDWRSLERLNIVDGVLADYGIVPESSPHNGAFGVTGWHDNAGTVTGNGRPAAGKFSVADPRVTDRSYNGGPCGVLPWNGPRGAVTSREYPSNGFCSIADPRWPGSHEYGQLGVRTWEEHCGAVSSQSKPGGGRYSVADPRCRKIKHNNCFRVISYGEHAGTVTGGMGPSSGGQAVADPRPGFGVRREHYQSAGHYGVVQWADHSYAVTGKAKHDTGHWSVADPRHADVGADAIEIPQAADRGAFIIRSMDDTWHRPFTTLELAALQGLVDGEEFLQLHGASDCSWRERIGNAVPRHSAAAIAGVMGQTLLLAWSGRTFVLDTQPIWVQPVAVALSVGSRA